MPFISDGSSTTLLFSIRRQSWAQHSHSRLYSIFYTTRAIAAACPSREVGGAEGADPLGESLGRFLRAKPNVEFQLKAAFMGNMEHDSLGWKLLQPSGPSSPRSVLLLSPPWKWSLARFTPLRPGACLPQSLLNLSSVSWAPARFYLFLLPLLINIF